MAEEEREDEEEEWETEEHIVGVSNINDDVEIDWEEVLGENLIPEVEEEYEVEDHIVGVSNIDINDRPIYSFPIERNDFPEEQEEIEVALETEERVVGVSNLTEDDIIPEEEVIEYEIIEEGEFSEEFKEKKEEKVIKEPVIIIIDDGSGNRAIITEQNFEQDIIIPLLKRDLKNNLRFNDAHEIGKYLGYDLYKQGTISLESLQKLQNLVNENINPNYRIKYEIIEDYLPSVAEKVKSRLEGKNITPLTDYRGVEVPLKLWCNQCNYGKRENWEVTPHSINRENWIGCPRCHKYREAYNKTKERLKDFNSSLLSRWIYYKGRATYLRLRCDQCGFVWYDQDKYIRQSIYSGCRICNNKKKVWNFFDYNDDDTKLTKVQRLTRMAKYFYFYVYFDLLEKGIIRDGEIPKLSDLMDNGHNDFYRAFSNRNIDYEEILHYFDNMNLKGSYFEKDLKYPKVIFDVEESKSFYKPKIIKSEEKEENQKIVKEKYEKRFYIEHKDTKWSFLKIDKYGKRLSRQYKLNLASDFFLNTIIPDLINRNIIFDDEIPSVAILHKHGYRGFKYALDTPPKINQNELLVYSGLEPLESDFYREIGNAFHVIGSRIFLQHTRDSECKSYRKVYPNRYDTDFKNNFTDNSIICDDNFGKLSKSAYSFLDRNNNIKIIHIEFFLRLHKFAVKDHSKRGYQDEHEYLMMIPLDINNKVKVPNNIEHPERILIYDSKTFLDFFGFSGDLRREFIKYAKMALSSIIDEDYRKTLINEAKKSREIIKKIFNFDQEHYEKDLKELSLSYLLFYNFKGHRFKKIDKFK